MILSLILLGAPVANATEFGVGLYGGYWALPGASDYAPDGTWGARARVRWSDAVGLELAGGAAAGGFDPGAELLFFGKGGSVTPFLAVGAGAVVGAPAGTAAFAGLGGGVDAALAPWLDFRADMRLRVLGEEDATASLMFNTGLQAHTPRWRDRDSDGIADKADACPSEAEDVDDFEDADGCPDADNDRDGVPDSADECRGEAEDADGHKDRDGCPDPDNDGDGVADGDDQCRDEAEDVDQFQDRDGCPDNDNDSDGLADATDRCPNEPETRNGFRDNDGCADEVPAEVAKFSGVIAGVNFETGKAVLLPSSRTTLDEAVAVMKKFEELRLEVQGHTDDVGDDAKNLALSQARAEAVVNYIVSHGIAADRLVAKGYGETQPKAPNDSKANRAANRRVEFKRL